MAYQQNCSENIRSKPIKSHLDHGVHLHKFMWGSLYTLLQFRLNSIDFLDGRSTHHAWNTPLDLDYTLKYIETRKGTELEQSNLVVE